MTASASVLWGTVFLAADLGLRDTNAYVLVFLRFLFASAIIGVIAALFDHRLGISHQLRRLSTWRLGFIESVGFLLQYVLFLTPTALILGRLNPLELNKV
jgi:drug/metabolite transporter (DMT)-like permease